MAAEWEAAVGHLAPEALQAAVSHAARVLKFFPTPAEILAIVGDQREQTSRLPHYSADMEAPFEPTAEERERVAALVAKWKREFGIAEPETPCETSKPASQDMTVSDALRNSRAARSAMAGRIAP